ncbi:uncharacterized protein LOC135473664 [Liolophura sinensis]|uniref:uncharacterized protein LOC135473664 n=1 Tax=Liolophura sinensis TaxID=3198878 RepID=UPI00315898D8
MAYYDPSKPDELIVDGSHVGLGAALTQKGSSHTKTISYASRSLTPVEQRYSQTELQGYSYNVTYRPGHDNPADFLSRHPVQSPDAPSKWKSAYRPNVNAKLDSATARQLQSFATVHTELSVNSEGSILLFGSHIVIPACLQQRVCDLAHVGHQGIVKTKKLLHQKVWFPGIDKLVETTIHNCIPCQAVTLENSSRQEPLKMTVFPQAPWENVCADFVGPLPSGDYLLIVYDESPFPPLTRYLPHMIYHQF